MLFQITLHNLTFGLVVEDGRVTKTAPVAFWTQGKDWPSVENYYRRRGATITVVEDVVDKPAASG